MSILLVTLLAISAPLFVNGLDVKNCGKGGVDVVVKLPACPTSQCKLAQGSFHEMEVVFKTPVAAKTLVATATGKLGPVALPWPGFDRQACNGYGISCPVTAGQDLTYKLKFEIKKQYPRITTDVVFKLQSDEKKEIFCFTFPLSIVSPSA